MAMKTLGPHSTLALAAALALSMWSSLALGQVAAQTSAQGSASAPARAASAAPAAQTGPRVFTPEEKRYKSSDTAAPDLVPDRAVIPQVSIPLTAKSTPQKPVVTSSRKYSPPTTGGGVNDAAARCMAEASDAARAVCQDKARKSKSP